MLSGFINWFKSTEFFITLERYIVSYIIPFISVILGFNLIPDKFKIPLFIVLIIIVIIGLLLTFFNNRKIANIEKQNQTLLKDKVALKETLDEYILVFSETITNELHRIAKELKFDDQDRISIYRHVANKFIMIGRYSENEEFNKPGRMQYNDNEGLIAEVWKNHGLLVRNRDYQLSPETLRKLRMESKILYGVPLFDQKEQRKVGVVIFETTNSTKKKFNATILKPKAIEINKFLNEHINMEPTIKYAHEKGF